MRSRDKLLAEVQEHVHVCDEVVGLLAQGAKTSISRLHQEVAGGVSLWQLPVFCFAKVLEGHRFELTSSLLRCMGHPVPNLGCILEALAPMSECRTEWLALVEEDVGPR